MTLDLVPMGPVRTGPRGFVSGPDQHQQMLAVLAGAGVDLGDYDHRIVDWLTRSPGQDWSTVATIASWIQRAAKSTT
ncbi:hypothetical protein [Streptomyces sp. NPDC058629]|uniref:hypothetical protein n=1 Tax=Streptomyces sp. NPDC058629 TaxID=3346565 RepID=UPI00364CA100